ncbi:response regulator [Undibacterium terreum]|uniref:Response regulator n=1 Tax=Undibacterium terreum TaxID=1224302 RepID=A0A916U9V4_9BURK|nr:response regulator transcription factor [Undibacterium terreum]GGC65644.1 response regulator [Undibacterium terreum]
MAENKSLSVFIIDDNEMTRSVLRMTIQGEDFDVIGGAANGKSGLERVLKLQPDIVCLDIVMPDTDGLELLQEIKQALPLTIVLMVTSSNDRETVSLALQRGAAGYILKPFNKGTILDTLEKVTVLRRA